MPIYQFKDKTTEEIIEKSMRISQLDQFKTDNPNLEQFFGNGLLVADPCRIQGTTISKGDQTFQKYIVNRIANSVPGNTLKDRKFVTHREW